MMKGKNEYLPGLEEELFDQSLIKEPLPYELINELKDRAFSRGNKDRFRTNKLDFENVADLIAEMSEAKDEIESMYAKGYGENTNARDLGVSDKALQWLRS